ncbi:MAG TPA: response regulator [Stellaceae bacterium]|nr:response regulator [Stellaceae bacterium]
MPRILLVEDDPEVRLLVEHLLLDAEYEVDSSTTLGGGLELIDSRDFDLVLADGRLEDGTGLRLADAARQRSIPALIMTGYAFVLHEPGVDPGDYDILLKPISPEELLEAVVRALEAKD